MSDRMGRLTASVRQGMAVKVEVLEKQAAGRSAVTPIEDSTPSPRQGVPKMDAVYERSVSGTIEEVGRRLEQAVQARRYGVLGCIDLREKMKSKGVDFGPACRIYEVCNPIRAKHVLEQDMSISTALPCRIALYDSAGTLKLATLRPRSILAGFGRPELEDEAGQVEEDLKAIIDEVASP